MIIKLIGGIDESTDYRNRSCLPEKIVTNDFLSTIVETSDEWISSRTGIRQRHIAIDETTASMSTEAGKKALESAGVKPEELDLIIVGNLYTGYAGAEYSMSGTE